jgi:hypothetical protein
MRTRAWFLILVTLVFACSDDDVFVADAPPGQPDAGPDAHPPLPDEDGDTIADVHEGRDTAFDTDGDDTPDYLDLDSDDDGIPDALEAGDADTVTPPVDSDGDSLPDFRDRDSDNDGLADSVEDADHDGVLDDGETDPTVEDTDGDGVSDLVESVAGTDPRNPDDNPAAHGNFVFLVPYQGDPAPLQDRVRFRTSIRQVDMYFLEDVSQSMGDELLSIRTNLVTMTAELTCDPGEPGVCPADCPATCDNGTCDPAENPHNCPQDCLGGCGDGVCIGNEDQTTCASDCPLSCGDGVCAATETPLTCPSDCTGTCGDGICHAGEQPAITGCIPDLWTGNGAFGTSSSAAACTGGGECDATGAGFVYENLASMQEDSSATAATLPSNCWGTGCWEPGLAALFYTVTGWGSASATAEGYTMPPLAVPEPTACPAGHRGYPCFRPESLPIILLIGDEPFSQCYLPDGASLGTCASGNSTPMTTRKFDTVSGAALDIGARVIGVYGSGAGDELIGDMQELAYETGTITSAGDPLVYSGSGSAAADAIAEGIRTLTATLPLDMSAFFFDDAADTVDTAASFYDHLEVYLPGTAECVAWPSTLDWDGDGFQEMFQNVTVGTPVCWTLMVKENTTVPATTEVQIFRATVRLVGDGATTLDTRVVYFVVPPELSVVP